MLTFITILPIIFSTVAFILTIKNEFHKKMSIKFDVLDEKVSEWCVDRTSDDSPDVYHQNKFRLIFTAVITNNSALPITITEFLLNDKSKFGFYTRIGKNYQVTFQSNAVEIRPGIYAYNYQDTKTLNVDLHEHSILKPPITIKPYESAVGVLFFHYPHSSVGKNRITLKSSRGSVVLPLTVSSQYISRLLTDYRPPHIDKF